MYEYRIEERDGQWFVWVKNPNTGLERKSGPYGSEAEARKVVMPSLLPQ